MNRNLLYFDRQKAVVVYPVVKYSTVPAGEFGKDAYETDTVDSISSCTCCLVSNLPF